MFCYCVYVFFLQEFNFDVDALFAHLFSQESDMMKRVFEERKHESKFYNMEYGNSKICHFFWSILFVLIRYYVEYLFTSFFINLDWRYTALEKDEENNTMQTLAYTLNLNYSIGPKTSDTVSKQVSGIFNPSGQNHRKSSL